MAFTVQQMMFLQRLIADKAERRAAGDAAVFLAEHFSLGRREGSYVEYDAMHFEVASQLLLNANLPLARFDTKLRRAEMAGYSGLSEKTSTIAPHENSIALRVASGECRIDGSALYTPAGSYLVASYETALRISADRLMVIENLETFRHLEKQRWIDYGNLSTLAIFRGDTRFNAADSLALVKSRPEPVWAFYDFDPAGLALANMTIRLDKVVSPPNEWLIPAARRAKRFDLYQDQIEQYRSTLEATSNTQVRALWALMKDIKVGYAQEWMENYK